MAMTRETNPHFNAGYSLLKTHEYEKAIQEFKQCKTDASKRLIGVCYGKLGKIDLAKKLIAEVFTSKDLFTAREAKLDWQLLHIQDNPLTSDMKIPSMDYAGMVLFHLCRKLEKAEGKGRVRDAIHDEFRILIKLFPSHVEAHKHLAIELVIAKKLEEATQVYKDLTKFPAHYWESCVSYLRCLNELGNYKDAIVEADKIIRSGKTTSHTPEQLAQIYNAKAIACDKSGNREYAKIVGKETTDCDPDYAAGWSTRAKMVKDPKQKLEFYLNAHLADCKRIGRLHQTDFQGFLAKNASHLLELHRQSMQANLVSQPQEVKHHVVARPVAANVGAPVLAETKKSHRAKRKSVVTTSAEASAETSVVKSQQEEHKPVAKKPVAKKAKKSSLATEATSSKNIFDSLATDDEQEQKDESLSTSHITASLSQPLPVKKTVSPAAPKAASPIAAAARKKPCQAVETGFFAVVNAATQKGVAIKNTLGFFTGKILDMPEATLNAAYDSYKKCRTKKERRSTVEYVKKQQMAVQNTAPGVKRR